MYNFSDIVMNDIASLKLSNSVLINKRVLYTKDNRTQILTHKLWYNTRGSISYILSNDFLVSGLVDEMLVFAYIDNRDTSLLYTRNNISVIDTIPTHWLLRMLSADVV